MAISDWRICSSCATQELESRSVPCSTLRWSWLMMGAVDLAWMYYQPSGRSDAELTALLRGYSVAFLDTDLEQSANPHSFIATYRPNNRSAPCYTGCITFTSAPPERLTFCRPTNRTTISHIDRWSDAFRKYVWQSLGPDGSRRCQTPMFDAYRDTGLPEVWTGVEVDAVSVVDGEFLLRPELGERWYYEGATGCARTHFSTTATSAHRFTSGSGGRQCRVAL